MADPRASRGKVVVDGAINYLSPSSLTTGDPDQPGGCGRRWHFKYVAGLKEPTTAAMTAGTELHAQVEHFLKTGEKALGAQALAGSRFIPAPALSAEGLLVEHAIGDGELTAAGVPVIGYMDLVKVGRGYIDEEGDRGTDPEGTVELLDWKTTSNLSRAKRGPDLIHTVQMPAYGEWAARKFDAEYLRLSHVYFASRGRPDSRKATRLHTREEIGKRWEGIERVARSLIQIARVKPEHSNQVEANPAACPVWGGCPRKNDGTCKVGGETSLAKLFGTSAAQSLLQGAKMSLLAKISQPVNTPAVAGVQLDLKGEMAKLAAEQAAAAAPVIPDGFAEACKAVESAGKGFPTLIGNAAKFRCALLGHELKGAGLSGSGMLGGLTLSDPAQLTQLADELGVGPALVSIEQVTPPMIAVPAGLLPSDAPESKPELAAKPLETPVVTATIEPMVVANLLPGAEVVAEAPKPKRGRPRKADAPPVSMRDASASVIDTSDADNVAPRGTGLQIFVDSIPSCPYDHLDPYVDGLCKAMAEQFGAVDVRCPPKDSPLSYGQWKGALAALAREKPPEPGTYVVFTRSEPAEVVADALRSVAELYVRGVR